MILYILCSFILGTITIPSIAWIAMAYFAEKFGRKKHLHQTEYIPMTRNQQAIFTNSLHKTKDMAWFNVWIQRHWYELAHSYAQTDRISRIIIKKLNFLKRRKITTEISVENIELSTEAPIVSNIVVLTYSQYYEILNLYDAGKHNISVDNDTIVVKNEVSDLFFECTNSFSASATLQTDNPATVIKHRAPESSGKHRNRNQQRNTLNKSQNIDDLTRNIEEVMKKKKFKKSDYNFDQMFFLADFAYHSCSKFHVDAYFFNKFKVVTKCSIGNFSGKILVRIPANNQNNKWEFSFLKQPGFMIDVNSYLSGINNNTAYFQGILSVVMKYILHYSLNKQLVFPNFHSMQIPMVSSNLKYIEHKIVRFDTSRYKKWARSITNSLLLYISMNYKIIKKNEFITYRRNNYFINGEYDRINLIEIKFQDEFEDNNKVLSTTMSKAIDPLEVCNNYNDNDFNIRMLPQADFYGRNHTDGTNLNSQNFNINNNKNHCEKIKTINKKQLKIIEELKLIMNVSYSDLIILSYFYNLNVLKYIEPSFLYLKMIKKYNEKISLVKLYFNQMIFDYIRIIRNGFIIFQRSSVSEPEFFIIHTKKNKLQIFSYLTNNLLQFSFKKGEILRQCIINQQIFDDSLDIRTTSMENPTVHSYVYTFKKMIEQKNTLTPKTVNFDVTDTILKEILDDPIIRFRLMGICAKIVDTQQIGENMLLYSLKTSSSYDDDTKIISFNDGSSIIDADISTTKNICFFNINNAVNNCTLTTRLDQSLETYFKRFLISPLMIKTKFYKSKPKPLLLTFDYNKSIEYKFRCNSGSILFELHSEIVDDFYVTIKIDKNVIFKNIKIITHKKNKFIITANNESNITIYIKPKVAKHRKFFLTILYVDKSMNLGQNEFMIDIITSLDTNKSIAPKINTTKGNILFWDLEFDENLVTIISSKRYKSIISGFGIYIANDDVYKFHCENKGLKNKNVRFCVGSTTNRLV